MILVLIYENSILLEQPGYIFQFLSICDEVEMWHLLLSLTVNSVNILIFFRHPKIYIFFSSHESENLNTKSFLSLKIIFYAFIKWEHFVLGHEFREKVEKLLKPQTSFMLTSPSRYFLVNLTAPKKVQNLGVRFLLLLIIY